MNQPSDQFKYKMLNNDLSNSRKYPFNQVNYLFQHNMMGQQWEERQISAVYNSLSPFLTDSSFLTNSFVFNDQSEHRSEEMDVESVIVTATNTEKQDKTMALQEEYSNFSQSKNNKDDEKRGPDPVEAHPVNFELYQEIEEEPNIDEQEKDVFEISKKKKKKKNKKHKMKSSEEPVSSFTQWLLCQKQIGKKSKVSKTISGKNKVKLSAQKSILPSEDIASESLAKILQTQGHFLKAKNMYKKLIQKFPEKSIQYQGVIEELNVLIEGKG